MHALSLAGASRYPPPHAATARSSLRMRPVHVLDSCQLDLVELLLTGCLAPRSAFSADLPLVVPPTMAVQHGDELELHDPEGVPIAYVQVDGPPPAVTGALIGLAGREPRRR